MALSSPYAAAVYMIAEGWRRDYPMKNLIRCLALPYLLISGPILMAAAPVGFLLSLVENRLPLVWCGLGALLQLASAGDLVTDVGMYIKVLLEYFKSKPPPPTPSPFDWSSTLVALPEPENDAKVFIIRSALMPFGALFVMATFFKDEKKDTAATSANQSKDEDKKKEKKPGLGVLIIVMLVVAIVWKVGLVFTKFNLIATMLLFRKDMKAMHDAMLYNLLCLGDLIASGIPLGVLTLLEMHDILFHWNYTYNWEVAKLILVGIDACAASNIVFFQLLPAVRRELADEDSIDSTPLNSVSGGAATAPRGQAPKASPARPKQPAPAKKPAPKPTAGSSVAQHAINVAS